MILITGATGFIGRRLIRRLVNVFDPQNILCLVHPNHSNPLEQSGRALLDALGIRYIPVDLATGSGMEQVPRSPDIVFHLASNTNTGARDHRINDVGTKLLMEAIQPFHQNGTFIFTSTISVSDHRSDPHKAGNENSVLLRPRSEYGRKKLETERYLREKCGQDGFSLSILRVSATYGGGTRAHGLFDALVAIAKQGSNIGRFDYPGLMTTIHVDDVADVLTRLAHLSTQPNKPRTFIAHAEVLSIHDMSAAIHEALHIPFAPIRLPAWFWQLTQHGSSFIYALERMLPHSIYNKLWQLTLLVNNGYNNTSLHLQDAFPDKVYKYFKDNARDLLLP